MTRSAALAVLGSSASRTHAQELGPDARSKLIALVRAQPGIDPRKRPVQKIEPVVMEAEAGTSAENLPIFDHFVGDLHLRYVFDDPRFMQAVRGRHLKRLGLTRDELPELVVKNYRRLYPQVKVIKPEPSLAAITNGGGLEPCILLDGSFWENARRRVGGDIIAAVPDRRTVVFTRRNKESVELLKHMAVNAYDNAGQYALSRTVLAWRMWRWEVAA